MGYITTGQAARRLGVGLNTIKRWIARGELEGVRTPGGHWRIPEPSFRDFTRIHGLEPVVPGASKPSRVLIVDDDPATCALLEGALEELALPCEVRCVQDGYSALLQVGAWCPDLLVLDIVMPGIDGIEVLRRLREDRVVGKMAIIVITSAYDRPVLLRAVRAAGPDAILPKPVDLPGFRACVTGCLATRRTLPPVTGS